MKMTIGREGWSEVMFIDGANQEDILPGLYRNFRGEKRKDRNGRIVNDEGKRCFNLALHLPAEVLDELAAMGLHIKEQMPKEPEYGDEPLRFVKVNVAMDGKYPPDLYLTNEKRNRNKKLSENQLAMLDTARFSNADLIIRLYHKDENTTTLYLSKGYFTIEEDPISAKYADYEIYTDDDEEEMPFH